jgi:hypothetical protein
MTPFMFWFEIGFYIALFVGFFGVLPVMAWREQARQGK